MRNLLLTVLTLGLLTTACTIDNTVNEGDTYFIFTNGNNPFGVEDTEDLVEVDFRIVPVETGDANTNTGKSGGSISGKSVVTTSTFNHVWDDVFVTFTRGDQSYTFEYEEGIVISLPKNEDIQYNFTSERWGNDTSFYLPITGQGTFNTGGGESSSVELQAETVYALVTVQGVNGTVVSNPNYVSNLKAQGDLFYIYVVTGLGSDTIDFDWTKDTYQGTGSSESFEVEAYNHYEFVVDVTINVTEVPGDDMVVSGATSVGFTIVLDDFTTDGRTINITHEVEVVVEGSTVSDGDDGVFSEPTLVDVGATTFLPTGFTPTISENIYVDVSFASDFTIGTQVSLNGVEYTITNVHTPSSYHRISLSESVNQDDTKDLPLYIIQ